MRADGLQPGDATRVFVSADRLEGADERFEKSITYATKAHEHLWVAIASYVLADATIKGIATGEPGLTPSLDIENLAGVQIGCFICEQALDRKLVGRRCPGEPR